MNTQLPANPRATRLMFAGLASLVTGTLFVAVATGLTGEQPAALVAQVRAVIVAAVSVLVA